jgi:hypothetical protein
MAPNPSRTDDSQMDQFHEDPEIEYMIRLITNKPGIYNISLYYYKYNVIISDIPITVDWTNSEMFTKLKADMQPEIKEKVTTNTTFRFNSGVNKVWNGFAYVDAEPEYTWPTYEDNYGYDSFGYGGGRYRGKSGFNRQQKNTYQFSYLTKTDKKEMIEDLTSKLAKEYGFIIHDIIINSKDMSFGDTIQKYINTRKNAHYSAGLNTDVNELLETVNKLENIKEVK